jgi:hypothetical protein
VRDSASRCSRSCTGEAPRDRGGWQASHRNPIRSESLRGFIARGVHHTAAGSRCREGGRFVPGEPGDLRCHRSLSGAEVARGGPPRVSPLRAGDPRRPSLGF